MSELVIGTTHTGAHIDAHAHMTVGDDDHWHGGSARTDLGDFGPVRGDATEIPPLWRRGVLYDVPGHRGAEALAAGEPVTADELLAIEAETGLAAGAGDVALVRTGYLSGLAGPGPPLAREPRRRPRHLGRSTAVGARRRGHRLRHRDIRGPARAQTEETPPIRSPCTRCC